MYESLFPFIFNHFSFVLNAANFFINSLNRFIFRSLYKKLYLLNACKLDWEEHFFDFYGKPIAFKIKILMDVSSI